MQGQLFTQDFLRFGILATPPYQALGNDVLAAFETQLREVFSALSAATRL